MIIVRAPMRLPIGGGGTDLPSYSSLYGGEWTSAAINKYVYVAVNKRFENTLRISYSKTEEVDNPDQVEHPIVREALKLLGIDGGIEIVSIADVFSKTGLGSSGSFTAALITALHAFLRKDLPSRKEIAEQACHITMDLLKEPSGPQDEYISVYGGIASFFTSKNGEIKVEPLYPKKISPETLRELENNLLMFYTGIRRESREPLKNQAKSTRRGDKKIVESLHRIKELGREIRESLINNDFHRFGQLLDLHWQEKIKRKGVADPKIQRWYEIAKENGAVGGKLLGAGGGGFFVFYCENQKDKLRKAMTAEGLRQELFHFDLEGVKVIADFV